MYFKQNVYFALENHENPIGMDVYTLDFPGSSPGKESICNAGDLWLIPGSGKSPGEEIGYPLQYTWASLMAQTVKNQSATWESWIRSLSQKEPLEKRMATHSSILAWRIPWTEKPGGLWSMGSQRVGHTHLICEITSSKRHTL